MRGAGLARATVLAEGAASGARLLAGSDATLRGAVVCAYHDITHEQTSHYQVPPDLMRHQLEWALHWGVRFVSLADLVDRFEAGEELDGLGSVVFDDALVGVKLHAQPILEDLHVPGTVFAVSDRLGERPDWWPESARLMNAGELVEIASAGFGVGAHSRTHRSLPAIEPDEVIDEIAGSRARLEDLTGRRVDLFAYPFGHYDGTALKAVEEAGYRAAFTFLNGRIELGLDRYRLPRLNMWRGQHRIRFAYNLARSPSSWGDVQPEAVHHGGQPAAAAWTA